MKFNDIHCDDENNNRQSSRSTTVYIYIERDSFRSDGVIPWSDQGQPSFSLSLCLSLSRLMVESFPSHVLLIQSNDLKSQIWVTTHEFSRLVQNLSRVFMIWIIQCRCFQVLYIIYTSMNKKYRLIASVAILAWAGALQFHMNEIQKTDAFKAKFPDIAESHD